MESSDSNESERDEEQMSRNSNSASVTGSTGIPGPRVIKFKYKEFTVKVSDGMQGVGTATSAFRTK